MQPVASTNWVCTQCQKSNVNVLHHCLRCNAARKVSASAQDLHIARRGTGTRASPLAPIPSATVSPGSPESARGLASSCYPTVSKRVTDEDLTASGSNLRRGVSAPAAPQIPEGPAKPPQTSSGPAPLSPPLVDLASEEAQRLKLLEMDRALTAKQRELKSVADQVNEAAATLAAHHEELARVQLQIDEGTLQVELSRLQSARLDLEVAKRRREAAKLALSEYLRGNEAPLAEMQTKEKIATDLMAEHKANEDKLAALTRNYAQEVPSLANMNAKHKQEWNDLGSSLFDMQHVLTIAIEACQTPQENELQRLKIELAQRKADLKAANEDKEFARKEQWTAQVTLDEEKAKLRSAEKDSKDMARKAELAAHESEELQRRLEVLKARYSEDVSALATNNTKLKQLWNDVGSALFDMQQTLVDSKERY